MDETPRSLLLELLLDLAYDASTYLRVHARRAVRISAALLVAGSLAACGGPLSLPGGGSSSGVSRPLGQEVRSGLPSQPGRYAVSESSVVRDEQGVYHFTWSSLGASAAGGQTDLRGTAAVSRLRLAQADSALLEIPTQGDPILYLRSQASVPLVSNSGGSGYGGFGTWYPFYAGGYHGIGYYDPPSRAVAQGGALYGSHTSSAPAAPSERTVGLPHTVSGRAGGTGSGQAASQKSGVSTSGTTGGAAAAKSGGFSSGRGGASAGGGG
jgi:hypothetical protein